MVVVAVPVVVTEKVLAVIVDERNLLITWVIALLVKRALMIGKKDTMTTKN